MLPLEECQAERNREAHLVHISSGEQLAAIAVYLSFECFHVVQYYVSELYALLLEAIGKVLKLWGVATIVLLP